MNNWLKIIRIILLIKNIKINNNLPLINNWHRDLNYQTNSNINKIMIKKQVKIVKAKFFDKNKNLFKLKKMKNP